MGGHAIRGVARVGQSDTPRRAALLKPFDRLAHRLKRCVLRRQRSVVTLQPDQPALGIVDALALGQPGLLEVPGAALVRRQKQREGRPLFDLALKIARGAEGDAEVDVAILADTAVARLEALAQGGHRELQRRRRRDVNPVGHGGHRCKSERQAKEKDRQGKTHDQHGSRRQSGRKESRLNPRRPGST